MVSEKSEIVENLGTVRLVGGKSLVSQRVVFSNDSRFLFCCCDRKIRVYSSATGDLLRELNGHDDLVTDIKINTRNHLQLISSSTDGSVILWDFTDGVILKRIDFDKKPLYGVLVHPAHEGKIFLIKAKKKGATSCNLSIVDTLDDSKDKTSPENLFPVSRESKSIAFSPKGDYIACVYERDLLMWSFKKEELKEYTYKKSFFTCVAFHPYEMCVAAGDANGKIIIWHGFEHTNKEPVTMELHWHAHQLSDLTFTSDGSYLLSGGEEAVLVLWQHQTHHKQFLPRLGGPIVHLTASPDDKFFAVSHKDNVLRLISGIELKVKRTIQGLRQASSGVPIVMTCNPRGKSLVMNSMPGILQFYQPLADHQANILDVVKQNFISNTDDETLVFTQLSHCAFSESGDWLATVEERDDKYTTPEIKLKFWEFDQQSQNNEATMVVKHSYLDVQLLPYSDVLRTTDAAYKFLVNTCVDPPHDGQVVSVEFQPSNCGELQTPLAVTVGVDGKFKIWTLGEELVIKGKRQAWHCQSVGYYGNMKCQDAAFSEDGSLLAVAYEQLITLWNPATNELHRTLHSPQQEEGIEEVVFGRNESSQYLVVRSPSYITVWNLLTCSVWWSLEANVSIMLFDPSSHCLAAFVRFSRHTHLYVFDPSSPRPVAVQENVESKFPVVSAVFVPYEAQATATNTENALKSRLYFLNTEQELFTIDFEPEREVDLLPCSELTIDTEMEQTDFAKIFGTSSTTGTTRTVVERNDATVRGTPSSAAVREMISTPSHVLPPVRSLCATFLKSLLVSRHGERDLMELDDDDDTSDKAESEVKVESDAEMEESTQSASDDTHGIPTTVVPSKQSIDYDRQETSPGDFSFLKNFFV